MNGNSTKFIGEVSKNHKRQVDDFYATPPTATKRFLDIYIYVKMN